VLVADRQQHLLRAHGLAARLEVELVDVGLDDGIDRAALLAEAAVDAFHEVDVVARRAPRAVVALVALDRDRERRAHRLAELAGDAALFPIGIAPQRVQAAEARALRRLLLGIHHGDLAGEEVASREGEALEELGQHEARGEVACACEERHLPNQRLSTGQWANGSIIAMPTTAIQMRVMGMKTFQPSRMIWS